jgi:hypothetical protein
MELASSVPLYLFSDAEAEPALQIRIVSTGRRKPLEQDKAFAEISLHFWVEASDEHITILPDYSITIVLPATWTPKLYLAALFVSANINNLICIDYATFGGAKYKSVNEVHWLFHSGLNGVDAILQQHYAFQHVRGGSYLE